MAAIVGIYRIVNTVTGKCYVGQSIDIERRWRMHRRQLKAGTNKSLKLQRSFNVHGDEAFAYEVCCVCAPEELDEKEEEFIQEFDSVRNGYNARVFATSNRGMTRSEETKAKVSAARSTPEAKAALAARNRDPVMREKCRLGLIAAKNTDEAKRKQSEITSKRWRDPAFRAASTDALKRIFATPESKAKRSAARKKAMSTEEARKAVSERMKALNSDPAWLAMRTERINSQEAKTKRAATVAKPEVKERMRESQRKYREDPVRHEQGILKGRITRANKKLKIIQ